MKKRNVICVIVCLVLIAAGCVGLYYLYNKKYGKSDLEDNNNVGIHIQNNEESVEYSKEYSISKKVLVDLFSTEQIENGNILKSKNGNITSYTDKTGKLNKNENYYVRAYCTTKDGTRLYGWYWA